MKALVLAFAAISLAALAGPALAEGGCHGSHTSQQTAETPPPPPPPAPTT